MRETFTRRTSSVLAGFCACTGLLLAAASSHAQATRTPSVQVYLVRQDSSDCTNSTVSKDYSPLVGGDMTVVRNDNGTTAVKAALTASPNTTYHVFLKCVRQIGDLMTDDEGVGVETFSFPTDLVGNVFAFDVYPEGAPPGNKFQSVQVQFQ